MVVAWWVVVFSDLLRLLVVVVAAAARFLPRSIDSLVVGSSIGALRALGWPVN